MKPSVWINPCLWAEAQTGLHNRALCLHAWVCVYNVCVCAAFNVSSSFYSTDGISF